MVEAIRISLPKDNQKARYLPEVKTPKIFLHRYRSGTGIAKKRETAVFVLKPKGRPFTMEITLQIALTDQCRKMVKMDVM